MDDVAKLHGSLWDWLASFPIIDVSGHPVLGLIILLCVILIFAGGVLLAIWGATRLIGESCFPGRRDAIANKELYDCLHELLIRSGCHRVYVLIFVNGTQFLPGVNVWKLVGLKETKVSGVEYALESRSDILASRMSGIVDPVITGVPYASGVAMAAPCGRCKSPQPCRTGGRRIAAVQVDQLPDGYERYVLEKLMVKTLLQSALIKGGNVFGMVCMDFCFKSLVTDGVDFSRSTALLCHATEKLQHVLCFKKFPAELLR